MPPRGSKDRIERPRRDLSRVGHTSQRSEQSNVSNNHRISKQKAGYEPLRLDSKPRAWGTVDRHNIPKGLRALQKGSNALKKNLGALQKGSEA